MDIFGLFFYTSAGLGFGFVGRFHPRLVLWNFDIRVVDERWLASSSPIPGVLSLSKDRDGVGGSDLSISKEAKCYRISFYLQAANIFSFNLSFFSFVVKE